jgi:hypothetical protein
VRNSNAKHTVTASLYEVRHLKGVGFLLNGQHIEIEMFCTLIATDREWNRSPANGHYHILM